MTASFGQCSCGVVDTVASITHQSSASSLEDLAPVQHHALERMCESVRVLIRGIGEDETREGLRDTPLRVAKAWTDLTVGYRVDPASVLGKALFHEPLVKQHGSTTTAAASLAAAAAGGSPGGGVGGSLVLVRDIHFSSLSPATLLPFHGRLHVAYLPANGVVLGLSKFARLAKAAAGRVQGQAMLASQVVSLLDARLAPQGVAVVVEAQHFEGAASPPPLRVDIAAAGCFEGGASSGPMREFLALLRLHGVRVPPPLPSPSSHRQQQQQGAARAVFGVQQQQQQFPLTEPCDGYGATAAAGAAAGGPWSDRCEPTTLGLMREAALALVEALPTDLRPEELRAGAFGYVEQLLCMTSGYCDDGIGNAEANPHPQQQQQQQHVFAVAAPSAGNGADAALTGALGWAPSANGSSCSGSSIAGGPPGAPLGLMSCQVEPFTSLCEHHMLPFHGHAYIVTVGGADSGSAAATAAANALRRKVQRYSRRLQVQERLTQQLADAAASPPPVAAALASQQRAGGVGTGANGHGNGSTGAAAGEAGAEHGAPTGVLLVCEAVHLCMVARGVEKAASRTVTVAYRGVLATDAEARAAALEHVAELMQRQRQRQQM